MHLPALSMHILYTRILLVTMALTKLNGLGHMLVIIASRYLLGRWYKDDIMISENIHIKSTECQFLKVSNGMCSLRCMASKSLEKIRQNRVLVYKLVN